MVRASGQKRLLNCFRIYVFSGLLRGVTPPEIPIEVVSRESGGQSPRERMGRGMWVSSEEER